MRLRPQLLICLAALLALSGAALAQTEGPCPECDEDGEPDDSWYNSVDTGVVGEDEGVLSDTDVSVGENEHGRFTWIQICEQFWDALGNFVIITFEAFVSEDGADIDGTVTVNGETVDLEDTPAGDLDDETWGHMEETGVLDGLPSHEDLPEPVDIDHCIYPDESVEVDIEATASCEIDI